MIEHVARFAAVTIAVVGLVDPTVVRNQTPAPIVALVIAEGSHLELPADSSSPASRRERAGHVIAELERELASRAQVVRGPHPDARAWVVVGAGVAPSLLHPGDVPAWTVDVSAPLSPNVAVLEVSAPPARIGERATVQTRLSGHGVGGRTSTVRLVLGELVLAEASHRWADAERDVTVRLNVTPWRTPNLPMRVHVATDGHELTTADNDGRVTLLVSARPWRVFVHESRPSWNVAFARRALETDTRFRVDARSVVSRRIAATQGADEAVPTALDATALAPYDVVIVGTPDLLNPSEWRALDSFARYRGGAVLVVPDRVVGRSLESAVDADWEERLLDAPLSLPLAGGGRATWQASEVAVARHLPAGADALSAIAVQNGQSGMPVVVRQRRGDGQVIVFGALDAWRHRGTADADFEQAWGSLIASAAGEAAPLLDVTLDAHESRPGSVAELRVRLRRSTWLDETGTHLPTVMAWLEHDGRRIPITLGPDVVPGGLAARIPVPLSNGTWQVVVDAPSWPTARVALPLVVTAAAAERRATVPLSILGRGHGGSAATAADLDAVVVAIERVLDRAAPPVMTPVHIMRSPWWIAPFAGLLGTEWWLRRRRGAR